VATKTDAYRGIVEAFLHRAGIEEPPVSMEAAARHLGVPIRLVRLPAFFKGALVSEEGLPIIMLNVASGYVEQRDALAHLLAHVLLVLDDPSSSYPRDTGDHIEADELATELVLPTQIVIQQAQLWFNDYRYLARLFGVDEQKMIVRMRDLGIALGPQAGIWDY